jgi:spore germination cell wall hydrolase CwlJ-like protein
MTSAYRISVLTGEPKAAPMIGHGFLARGVRSVGNNNRRSNLMLTAFVRVSRFVGWSACSAAAALSLTVSLSTFQASAADAVVSEYKPGLYRFESGRVGMKPVSDNPGEAVAVDPAIVPDIGSSDVAAADAAIIGGGSADAPSPVVHSEKHCLATAIYFEARGESAKGQKAVAEVILARTRTRGRPSTICGVVYEGSHRRTGCQFSFTCDRAKDVVRNASQWAQAQRIASTAISTHGKVKSVSRGATFYHADYVKPGWARRMVRVAQIGSHIFYRPKRGRLL